MSKEGYMALKPLADRIVIKRLEAQDKTKSGIIVPDSAKERPQEGKVVAVGTGKLLEEGGVKPLQVKSGDRVLYGKYSGTEVILEGEEFLILKEEDVLAVVQS
jgi:chaperonin GroES